MILGLHGEALLAALERRAFRHGPRQQHAVAFEAEVVVHAACGMLLHHEQQRPLPARRERGRGLGGGVETPLGGVFG